ncbi:MAG: isoleucine--tRNA ligase [bacterium]|nr:isoleucine--tRNA ligase [bacterium]
MESTGTYNLEKDILVYWKEKNIFEKLRKQNSGQKNFSFLDGPITANNPMGVHHAWGRTLKDLYQRYHAMKGEDERYQNGFDCQGLWLEVETEKSLGFNSKKDIEHFGLDKFSQACRARVEKYSAVQTEQSQQLGQWMDWGKDYFTMADSNIEGIWFFLQKCHKEGWLYKGKRILPWCIRCGTSSSKHEMSDDGYAELVHPSLYVKAKLKDKENEYLLLWTTTEWTLSSNVAAAVNPEHMYVAVKKGDDVYYISEALVQKLKKDYTILRKLKGKEMLGWEYESFYPDFEVQKGIVHKVILWNEVGESEGTGIVHIAPSCGEEDYELGKKLGLKILDPALDDYGVYNKGFSWLTGKGVMKAKEEIVKELEKRNILFAVENYKHRYPVCWRCKHELVFRLDSSWFLACDELRPRMKEAAATVQWYPEHVGKLMQDWLDNMEDWNISRRRYWGLPLMFYECSTCNNLTVVGSRKELREKAVDKKLVDDLPELHRPWIDAVKIKCSCGAEIERITDVGDCWLDAGIVPFTTLKYFEDKNYWKKWFPIELEIEMRAQVRLWFYAQLFMSVVLEGVAPYKRILAYEEVRDEKGKAMHKSAGNAIWFDDAVQKMGADIMRWQYCSQNPQYNICFGYGPGKEVHRHLLIILNLARYVKENCQKKGEINSDDPASRWIVSRRERLVQDVTGYLDGLEYHKAMEAIKNYLLFDLSKTYVQFIRDDLDDKGVQKVLYDSYLSGITLLAPFLPFISEKINIDLFCFESIHLQKWPKVQEDLIDGEFEDGMSMTAVVLQALMAARDKEKVNVRWPLEKAVVYLGEGHDKIEEKIKIFLPLLLKQVNLKGLQFVPTNVSMAADEHTVTFPYGAVVLDLATTKALEEEGFAREIMRRVQALRKEAGLKKEDRIELAVHVEGVHLVAWAGALAERCGAKIVHLEHTKKFSHMAEGEIRGKKFVIGFERL